MFSHSDYDGHEALLFAQDAPSVRLPTEVARDSGMISRTIPI